MRLRAKLLLAFCLVWTLYLTFTFLVSRFLAVNHFLYTSVLLGVFCSGLSALILHHLVIHRVEKLHRDVRQIGETGERSQRLQSSGSDELAAVSSEINQMLTRIEHSESQLDEKVRERTVALEKARTQLEEEVRERKRIEKNLVFHKEHLARLAHYDSLTGLPNQVLFNSLLNTTIEEARQRQQKMAILFISIDRFRQINHGAGHITGNLLIREIAMRITRAMRAGDILSRYGGEEFILMLSGIRDKSEVQAVAEKIQKICLSCIQTDQRHFFVSASIGICLYPEHGGSLEELQKNIDIAMYHAKRKGGHPIQFFSPTMKALAHEEAQIETALRKAMEDGNEFSLHFQPKLDIRTGSMTRAEALIRWDNPEIGSVSPSKFIPLAEATGLIMAIGEWTLRKACFLCKAWQDAGYPRVQIAVNLSPTQFRHQNVPSLVESILAETGLDPACLEIEITETAVMDDVETAIHTLQRLSDMGVTIAMDDFGTGYTSISYLKQFPVSVLKIDQSFIKDIPGSRDDVAIVTGIIALAHSLGMTVVAEGVETAEQLQFLADSQCDIAQGYYLSRPLPEDQFLQQLAADRPIEPAST